MILAWQTDRLGICLLKAIDSVGYRYRKLVTVRALIWRGLFLPGRIGRIKAVSRQISDALVTQLPSSSQIRCGKNLQKVVKATGK